MDMNYITLVEHMLPVEAHARLRLSQVLGNLMYKDMGHAIEPKPRNIRDCPTNHWKKAFATELTPRFATTNSRL